MAEDLKSPFLFVPEGAPVPDAVKGPEWIRIPATFVPRPSGRLTSAGHPWPRDRHGRDWARDRFGRPICPLNEMAPGVRAPGEDVPSGDDPVAAFMAMEAVFRDPIAAAGLTGQLGTNAGSTDFGNATEAQDSVPPAQGALRANDAAKGGPTDPPSVEVVLPNGAKVPDKQSPTGWLMSPVGDLGKVAATGRTTGSILDGSIGKPDQEEIAIAFFVKVGSDVGQGGTFDFQRDGNHFTGFKHYPQFADVSNFNVGLYCQRPDCHLI